jgi:hypothetical protein
LKQNKNLNQIYELVLLYIAEGTEQKDENFQIWIDFLFNRGCLYQGCRNAVRFTQHDLIKSYVKTMALDFYAVGKNPNAWMIMHWLSVLATAPVYWSKLMVDALTLSMSGRKNHNVALDFYNERLVDTISSSCNRFACSKNTAERVLAIYHFYYNCVRTLKMNLMYQKALVHIQFGQKKMKLVSLQIK